MAALGSSLRVALRGLKRVPCWMRHRQLPAPVQMPCPPSVRWRCHYPWPFTQVDGRQPSRKGGRARGPGEPPTARGGVLVALLRSAQGFVIVDSQPCDESEKCNEGEKQIPRLFLMSVLDKVRRIAPREPETSRSC